MKLRHTAALALVGWYLMLPPVVSRWPLREQSNAPLSRWAIMASFDSAEHCENAHANLDEEHKDRSDALVFLGVACIGTDDPRLKGN